MVVTCHAETKRELGFGCGFLAPRKKKGQRSFVVQVRTDLRPSWPSAPFPREQANVSVSLKASGWNQCMSAGTSGFLLAEKWKCLLSPSEITETENIRRRTTVVKVAVTVVWGAETQTALTGENTELGNKASFWFSNSVFFMTTHMSSSTFYPPTLVYCMCENTTIRIS